MFPGKRYTCVLISQLQKLLNLNLFSSSSRMIFQSEEIEEIKGTIKLQPKIGDKTISLL